ncbi:MAG: SemiSWEET transporter [Nanoarchaeota archaeon]
MDPIVISGLTAATFTTVAGLPQLIKSWKLKETKDISLWMYILNCVGSSLWLAYGILIKDLPLMFAQTLSL